MQQKTSPKLTIARMFIERVSDFLFKIRGRLLIMNAQPCS